MALKSDRFWNFFTPRRKRGILLQFGRRRRQFTRHYPVRKSNTFVAPVAERFIRRLPAAAQRNDRPPRKSERRPRGIHNLEIAFNPD